MGTRPKVWIALNGLEFTPPGVNEPACWPWRDVEFRQGAMALWLTRHKDHMRVESVPLGSSTLAKGVGMRLKARALRRDLARGREFFLSCPRSDEGDFAFVLVVGGLACAVAVSLHKFLAVGGFVMAGILWLFAAILLVVQARRNVTGIVIAAGHIGAQLKGGEWKRVGRKDLKPMRRFDQFESNDGLVLRFKTNQDIRIALAAAGLRPKLRYGGPRALLRDTWKAARTGVVTSFVCGLAAAALVYWLGSERVTGISPLRIFGISLATGGVGLAIPLAVWLQVLLERLLTPTGIKLHSNARRADSLPLPSSPLP